MVKRKKKWDNAQKVFVVLGIIVLVLGTLSVAKSKGWLIPEQPKLEIINNVITLNSLNLEQKIAQMLIVQGNPEYMQAWKSMQIGGIHLFSRKKAHVFTNTIIDFQYDSPIPFFVTADFEGCVSPFGHLVNSTPASEIKTIGQSFEKGFREGEFMKQLGFNLNFAPVVDLDDQIWKCRAFPGNEKEISELAQSYILGLQSQGIIASAKHYPGKTLVVKDPHKFVVSANIEYEDVFPYKYLSEKGDVDSIMVSHLITTGQINSSGIPSVVNEEVIGELKKQYDGLIISDEIHMLGLKNFYDTLDEMYVGVFAAGNDIILNFDNDPNEVYRMVQVIKKAVKNKDISAKQIDNSVTKILEAKGFIVK
jgi:beta-N-acetylhexosaminidase